MVNELEKMMLTKRKWYLERFVNKIKKRTQGSIEFVRISETNCWFRIMLHWQFPGVSIM